MIQRYGWLRGYYDRDESDSEVQRICNRKERTERKKRSVVVLECLLKMWRHLALGDS